jgi:hypothetical protein
MRYTPFRSRHEQCSGLPKCSTVADAQHFKRRPRLHGPCAVNGPPGMKRGGPLTGYATIRRARTDLPARQVMNHSISPRCRCEKRCIGPSPLGPLYQWNQTDPNGLSEPWRTSYGTHRLRRAVRTRCIHRSAWASALPQMPSPSDCPERCPNSCRVRVPDTQMRELRPRL